MSVALGEGLSAQASACCLCIALIEKKMGEFVHEFASYKIKKVLTRTQGQLAACIVNPSF